MKQAKKLLALFLALICILPCLGTPALAAKSDFVTNLAGFEETGVYSITADGLYAKASGKGDQFIFSQTRAGDFVYEADVTFKNPDEDGAAALTFRSSGGDRMYVANLNGKTGETRVFKFGDRSGGGIDMGAHGSVDRKADDAATYHLKVTVIGTHIVYCVDGKLVLNSADYTMHSAYYGQDDAYLDGTLGLMTWNTDVVYQNVKYTALTDATSPELKGLSVTSNDGRVDKDISFHEGQYVYITYVSNNTTSIKLNCTKKGSSVITATDEDGKSVDINALPVTKDFQTYTLTSKMADSGAEVVYRIRVHRCQPDETYYNEDWRGQFHYSVKDSWANDPNGMVYYKGTYHLFYQYYDGITWGTMHWAHATSTDLIHWTEHPIEFYPDEYGVMYSGCAVVADHATAPDIFGEGEEGIVIFITANGVNGDDAHQRVTVAYSKDGEHFEKYKEGKVVLHWKDDVLDNIACRDPKVFRYENKWFMVIAGGPLRIYSSPDLINWTPESTYGDLNTECPDLYCVPVEGGDVGEVIWVLSRGGLKYKLGEFKQVNGKWSFVPLEQYASPNAGGMGNEDNDGIMNFGKDSYAGMTYYMAGSGAGNSFAGLSRKIIEINWMNTWFCDGFPNSIAAKTGNNVFNGSFTLQLELGAKKDTDGKYYLTQMPVKEYEGLRDAANKTELKAAAITADNKLLANFSGDSYEIVATIDPKTSKEFGFRVRSGEDEETVVKYDNGSMVIDRSKSGILIASPSSGGNVVSQAAKLNADGTFTFHIYVDRASVEAFNGDYTVAGAMQIFPSAASRGLSVFSDDGSAVGNITVYPLRTIWTDKTVPDGPIAITLNKSSVTCYTGDAFTLDSWLSPGDAAQELVYSVTAGGDVVSLTQNGRKAEVSALKTGTATIRVAGKNRPELAKDCVVRVTANNFKTNLKGFDPRSGSWFVDDVSYTGSHNDNAFLYSDFINSDHFSYEIDAQFESGILNFIFQSQSKDPYAGCYALQINDGKVRLFDFKGDKTLAETQPHALPKADSYHVEIQVDGQSVTAKINNKEYINTTITDPERQYKAGYVALGLFFAEARYQNFFVNAQERENRFNTNLSGFEIVDGAWYVDGRDYIASYTGNAFLYGDYIASDRFAYEVDTQCDGGVLNYIFRSQTKNPFDGCYALQINADGSVRLFDFKGDKTLAGTDAGALPKADSYHVEIQVDGQSVVAIINNKEYINTTVTDPERQYESGYAALGLYNSAARYQNFFVSSGDGSSPFLDVSAGKYYYDALLWAVDNGIVSGEDRTFSPYAACTRGEMAAFLWHAANSPTASGGVQFTDVSEDELSHDAVAWASANGIADGTGNNEFSPNATVTRGEAATFLYRYAGSQTVSGDSGFADIPSGQYYSDAVAWAVANGVTNGTGTNTFSPASPCTRSQIVTFLYRLLAE